MTSNYLVWARDIVPGACALSGLTGFEDDWKLIYGDPVAGKFPAKARFAMNPDSPRNMMLADSLYNLEMLIVASERLKAVVDASDAAQVEAIPVPIFNHKKRRIAEQYYILHPVDPVDCLVIDECEAEWDKINKEAIARVKHLAIDETKIPRERLLFRPKYFCDVILVHRTLAAAIDAAGITGVRWVDVESYPDGA